MLPAAAADATAVSRRSAPRGGCGGCVPGTGRVLVRARPAGLRRSAKSHRPAGSQNSLGRRSRTGPRPRAEPGGARDRAGRGEPRRACLPSSAGWRSYSATPPSWRSLAPSAPSTDRVGPGCEAAWLPLGLPRADLGPGRRAGHRDLAAITGGLMAGGVHRRGLSGEVRVSSRTSRAFRGSVPSRPAGCGPRRTTWCAPYWRPETWP